MKIIGHRGARGLAEENTLEGLKKALEVGVDMIEFDVRATPTGVAVLHHNRLPKTADTVTELASALRLVQGRVPLYIEVKRGEKIDPIIKELKDYKGAYWLGSKSQKTLMALHKALPKAQIIVIEPWSGLLARRRAKQVDTKLLAMNWWWLWSGFIKAMSRSGYQLYAYTLNSPNKAKRWQKYGLAGVVTDYPDRFMRRPSRASSRAGRKA